ncbi:hypothetical protein [Streptomyces sp. NPDC048350]|uniref:hypothetical protein n=1 Tax=Streptomyces sp. NPDC048350 TaxID=3365538 RepID=UPI003717CBA8
MNPVDADGREDHPLLHGWVRDIASRGEGELTAVVHEWHGGRLIRIAHIQPVNGVAWSTAADNIGPARQGATENAGARGMAETGGPNTPDAHTP